MSEPKMIWGLLEPNAIFQEGDEFLNPMSGDRKVIPKNWIGCKNIRDNTTTMGRMNIQIRRKL